MTAARPQAPSAMPTPRRVLILHDYAGGRGGAEHIALDLRRGLRLRGIEARLLTSTADPFNDDQAPDATCPGRTDGLRVMSETWNPAAARAVANEIKRFQPDIVQIVMFLTQLSPAILSVLDSVPAVYTANTYRATCPTGLRWRPGLGLCSVKPGLTCCLSGCVSPLGFLPRMIQSRLARRGRDRLDRIVAPSHAMAGILSEHGWPVDHVVPYTVEDIPRVDSIAATPVIAYAGRLTEEKGLEVLVRAVAAGGPALASTRLLIVGDGPHRAAIESLVMTCGLTERTTFTGYLGRAESQTALEQAWVQVVPSLWPEPFGLVAAEAMMRGTAVIVSDSGALPEVVGTGGIVVPAANVAALAAALVEVVADRGRAESLGKAGRIVATRSLASRPWIDAHVAIYRDLLNG